MKRTLYLNSSRKIEVKRDGPSLLIQEDDMAGRRVPIRMLGGVVIKGNIRLESGVITELAAWGIPVSFLSRRGSLMAASLSINPCPSDIMNRISQLKGSEGGRERVIHLLRLARRNMMRSVMISLLPATDIQISLKGLRERDFDRYTGDLLPGDKEIVKPVLRIVRAIFHEMALSRVVSYRIDPHAGFMHETLSFSFVKDLLYVMEPEVTFQTIRFFGNRTGISFKLRKGKREIGEKEMRNLVVRFENRKVKILPSIDNLLYRFMHLLRESE